MARDGPVEKAVFELQSGVGSGCVKEEEKQMQRPEVGVCTSRWLTDNAVEVQCGCAGERS